MDFGTLCLGSIVAFFVYCFVAAAMGWDPTRKTCKHCGREFYVPMARYRGDQIAIRARLVHESHLKGHK